MGGVWVLDVGTGPYVMLCDKGPNGFLTVIFYARTWDGKSVNAEPRKHAKVAWFPVTEVPAEPVPDRREALLDCQTG